MDDIVAHLGRGRHEVRKIRHLAGARPAKDQVVVFLTIQRGGLEHRPGRHTPAGKRATHQEAS